MSWRLVYFWCQNTENNEKKCPTSTSTFACLSDSLMCKNKKKSKSLQSIVKRLLEDVLFCLYNLSKYSMHVMQQEVLIKTGVVYSHIERQYFKYSLYSSDESFNLRACHLKFHKPFKRYISIFPSFSIFKKINYFCLDIYRINFIYFFFEETYF